jgi:hypothetical protein
MVEEVFVARAKKDDKTNRIIEGFVVVVNAGDSKLIHEILRAGNKRVALPR